MVDRLARTTGSDPVPTYKTAMGYRHEPDKFGLAARLPAHSLPVPTTLFSSDTDPWMSAASARRWAARWGAHLVSLGDVGHINAEAGFGPLPRARRWVDAQLARQAREHRFERAELREWSFAV